MADMKKIATRVSYGNTLVELARQGADNLVVFDADLAAARRLLEEVGPARDGRGAPACTQDAYRAALRGRASAEELAEARRKRSIESLEHAQTARAWLQENVVTVSATAGDNGRLFGAITTATLADAVKAAGGPAVDRRKIQVVPPIKSTGRHSASVRLHADVVAPLEVNVVPAR